MICLCREIKHGVIEAGRSSMAGCAIAAVEPVWSIGNRITGNRLECLNHFILCASLKHERGKSVFLKVMQ